MKIFKNCTIMAPEALPFRDVLVVGEKIAAVGDGLSVSGCEAETIDLGGDYLCPGFIDQHVHIIGGGGQFGHRSLIPAVTVDELASVGTTTVLGLLGTDGFVKDLPTLYSRTKALDEEGLTAYMLTSFYGLPEKTLMGSVAEDMIFIDKVIGCKLAMSDDRSSFPTELEVLRLVNQIRLGGFTSGKHGVLHIHLGNLPTGISTILSILEKYPTLISYFSPTHTIRTRPLFEECVKFAKMGGMMDVTTGGTKFTSPHEAIALALEAGVPLSNLTFSSDGHGGVKKENPATGEITYTPAPLNRNYLEMVELVRCGVLSLDKALTLVTTNPAKNLSLKGKGRIAEGFDADFVVLHRDDLSIANVYSKGKKFV